MGRYIINKNKDENGKNEIHNLDVKSTKEHLPDEKNQVKLGDFDSDIKALNFAKQNGWTNADGSKYCCPRIHTM